MRSGWELKSIDELARVGRGRSRHRPRNDPSLYGGDYPFVQTAEIHGSDLRITSFSQTYSDAGLAQSKLWEPGVICITNAGENTGDCAILGIQACFPDSVIAVEAEEGKADPVYLKYAIDLLKPQLRRVTRGATQDNLSVAKLLAFKFPVPPYPVQQQIGETLRNYGDLIENNSRRMELLEQSVHLLYQEWFVRLRFPGHEHTSLVDRIPVGWNHVATPDVIEINPATQLSNNDEHWWVEMADLPTGSMVVQSAVRRPGRSGSKFQNGDVLFARITPCLENGKTAIVNFLADGEVGRGSTEFIVLRSRSLTPEFVYCLARTYDFRENAIKSMIGASGRQRVQESCFEKFLVLVPPKTLLDAFQGFARPIFHQIRILDSQLKKLRAARELLMPRLMSGEIQV